MRHLRSPFLIAYFSITLCLSPAFANPQGGQVVGGTATIQGQGTSTVTVNQGSDRAIINWNTFNLGAGDTTRFIQPNSSSIALNRVTGGLGPSQIFGTIQANGRVFLVNPNGVLFGQGAVIDTAGFLTTTHDIKNDDFMNAQKSFAFTIPGNPGASVVNLGTITATNGGIAALVAPGVRNSGTIVAEFGKVAMAAGDNGFTLDLYGDKLITLQVNNSVATQVIDVATNQPLDALVKNEGALKANGGRVELTAAAARQLVDSVINNTGVIEANSVGTKNGMIVLGAATAADKPAGAPAQNVKIAGTLSAAGKNSGEKGGKIQITGEKIALAGAKVDASGKAGGGKVLIGGDVGGGKGNAAVASIAQAALETAPVATASSVTVDAATLIDVSAKDIGSGGKLVVWSDSFTSFAGAFQARGGANGGDGGFAEVSSKGVLSYNGFGDLRAPAGKFGTLLLDPDDVNIVSGSSAGDPVDTYSGPSTLYDGTLNNALNYGNVLVTSDSGSIIVNSGAYLHWLTTYSLTLSAANNITIDGAINATNGGLTLNAGGNISASANVNVGTFTLQNGAWSQLNFDVLPAFSAKDFRITGGSFLRALAGDGDSEFPYQIADVYGLQGIGTLLGTHFQLANNIDASGTANWNSGAGFKPVGNLDNKFQGRLDGNGNTISGLTIASNAHDVGLFGVIGSYGGVSNVTLANASVTATGGSQNVGTLAGMNMGLIENSSASGKLGNLTGPTTNVTGAYGGLVGYNEDNGTVSGSSANVAVTVHGPESGYIDAGGLVGANLGEVKYSYATGKVTGASFSSASHTYLGGLVGWNWGGVIRESYATGVVSGTGDYGAAGGLIGTNQGQIYSSYALGAVSLSGAASQAGGFVGWNSGTIDQAYSSGAVTVSGEGSVAGGFAGTNTTQNPTQLIFDSYWDTQTAGLQLAGIGSGQTTGVTGLVASQARTQSSYGAFDFSETWYMIDGYTRPFLRSEWSTNIANAHQLQLMAMDLGANYTLVNNVGFGDAFSNPSDMWGPGGFVPIGASASNAFTPFTGSLDGQNYTIDGLKIAPNNPLTSSIGLFAVIGPFNEIGGWVRDLNLTNVDISANTNLASNTPSQFIGALAGQNAGWIENVTVSGLVNGQNLTGVIAGGLVGQNGVFGPNPGTGKITHSSANVAVTVGNGCAGMNCNGGWNTAGGLVGFNPGTIQWSYASGAVSVGSNAFGGGLVGANQNYVMQGNVPVPIAGALIENSWAEGNVSSNGVNVAIGGLVGSNAPLAEIRSAWAFGDVTATAAVALNNTNCTSQGNCQFVSAGGLVGQNAGIIAGQPFEWPPSGDISPNNYLVSSNNYSAYSYNYNSELPYFGIVWASGNVQVGSHATGGGLVGHNTGTISYGFATGNVTGAAGIPSPPGSPFDGSTTLGGLVGSNQGTIEASGASGHVGSPDVAMLAAGGMVGDNSGTISNSFAWGNVSAGNDSIVGGLVAANEPWTGNCGMCWVGTGQNSDGTILQSAASGNVSAGNGSVAGGFVGYTNGLVSDGVAIGNVSAGSDSIVGGFAGVVDTLGSLALVGASGNVSAGSNSIVGGLVGANAGLISEAAYVAMTGNGISGGSNSSIGGLVGQNFGTIAGFFVDPPIVATGPGSSIGGVAGYNSGGLSNGEVIADLSGGGASFIGPVVGFSAQGGTMSDIVSSQVTVNNGSGTGNPTAPIWVPDCTAAVCGLISNASFSDLPGNPNQPQQPPIFWQVYQPLENQNQGELNLAQPNGGTPPSGGNPPNNNNSNPPPPRTGPPPGPGIGRTLSEQQFSGVPPLNETRFLPGEVVVQISNTVSPDRIQQLARQFGLTIISSQGVDGRTIYRFSTGGGKNIRDVIRTLEKNQVVASAQPNYTFNLAQDVVPVQAPAPTPAPDATGSLPPSPELSSEQQADMAARTTLPAGDSAQYIIDKLRLGAVHTRAVGRNVTVAVIDSEIDTQHPDLAGVISDKFDATGTASSPHAHGTGMAGAIASKRRLLGIAPGVRILAVKAFDETSTSAEATSYQILKGLDWAIAKKVRIINMSFAGPRDLMVERSLQKAYDQGIVLIAAAGNAGPKSPPLYPAADVNVIAVSATDYADKPFKMANQGKYIAVAAPGVDVLVPAPKGAYQLTTGTSVAAAHVSGVAALLLEGRPTLTPKDVRAILTSTARAINPKGKDDVTGAGLVDPYQALTTMTARALTNAPATRAPATH